MRLSEFSGVSKCDNHVITCRGVRNFESKPQLVGGCQKFPIYAENHFWKPSSFFNQFGTYKQIYTHIHLCSLEFKKYGVAGSIMTLGTYICQHITQKRDTMIIQKYVYYKMTFEKSKFVLTNLII